MAGCAKCWSDAHRGEQYSVADEYARLLAERAEATCTPEQQAGPDATICVFCNRKTVHQYAHVCMLCGVSP